jgi:hypothetical protein
VAVSFIAEHLAREERQCQQVLLQNIWLEKRGSDSKFYCRTFGYRREAVTASFIAEYLAREERQ